MLFISMTLLQAMNASGAGRHGWAPMNSANLYGGGVQVSSANLYGGGVQVSAITLYVTLMFNSMRALLHN